jgi:HlyD family secretion protein
MSAPQPLFRSVALERLSTPERLDRLVTLTSMRSWLALAALCLIIASLGVWSILGRVPTRVNGRGILVGVGGSVYDAMAPAAGNVAAIKVLPGAIVNKGDTIAELVQPAARETLENARQAAAELKDQENRLAQQFAAEEKAQQENLQRQRAALNGVIEGAKQRVAYYTQTLASMQELRSSGFVTRQRVQEIEQGRQQADQDLRHAESDLVRLDAQALEGTNRRRDDLTRAQMQTSDARRHVDELQVQLAANSVVTAPVSGRVTEIKASEGAVVRPGMPVASVQSGDRGLELVLYIPPEHGKKVKPGMPVRIAPITVKKEEYGTMLGEIVSISDFPATPEGMQSVLQNSELVRDFMAQGPPYAARVRLFNADRPGQYRWTSGDGPPVVITAGTLADARVTVRESRPITLVVPLFKELIESGP